MKGPTLPPLKETTREPEEYKSKEDIMPEVKPQIEPMMVDQTPNIMPREVFIVNYVLGRANTVANSLSGRGSVGEAIIAYNAILEHINGKA